VGQLGVAWPAGRCQHRAGEDVKALVGSGLVLVFALPTGLAGVLIGSASSTTGSLPSAEALADIPGPLLIAYQSAASTCPGLAWPVLAAIGKVETDHGRHGGAQLGPNGDVVPRIVGIALTGAGGSARVVDTDGGRLDGDPIFDHAVGPMQFLPGTWARWGRDGNGDGLLDPHNVYDAIAGAAAYLCGDKGRVTDVAAAVATYNRSAAYGAEVLAVAARYATPVPLGVQTPSLASVLAHPNLSLSGAARADLQSGLVDPRVVAVLGAMASHFRVGVGVIKTGHYQCVGGGDQRSRPDCAVSEHWYYRGVDLSTVNGRPVSTANAEARALAELLARLPSPLRPDELGVPWAGMDPLPGIFSDADHQGHLHLGYRQTAGGR